MEATKVIDKKKILVPKFRFKGFSDQWEKKTLFDISENVSYGMNAAATNFDGIHKYIRITDIEVNSGEFKPDPLTSPLGEIDEKFKLKKGDIVFARTGASVGKSHLYNPKDGALYFAGFLIKFSITKANPFFIYSLTLKEAYNKWVHIYSMRSGQPGLNAEEYKALKLNIPTLPEQQKIASFLLVVDEKIQQLTCKKELLEQYKKGVMQQLFLGKLKFKDENGKAFPKWEETEFGNIADKKIKWSITGGPFGSNLKAEDYTENGIRIIQLQNIGDGVFLDDYKIYTSEKKADELISCNIYAGDIILSKMGDPVARACIIPITNKRWVMCSDGIRLVIDKSKFNKWFIYDYINSPYFRNKALTVSTGSTRKRIGLSELKQIPIFHPCLKEQEKIGNFLNAINLEIESLDKQITQTQTFKKGLLQQMFV